MRHEARFGGLRTGGTRRVIGACDVLWLIVAPSVCVIGRWAAGRTADQLVAREWWASRNEHACAESRCTCGKDVPVRAEGSGDPSPALHHLGLGDLLRVPETVARPRIRRHAVARDQDEQLMRCRLRRLQRWVGVRAIVDRPAHSQNAATTRRERRAP